MFARPYQVGESGSLKNKLFTLKEAKECGVSRFQVTEWLKEGYLRRISHNYYQYYTREEELENQFEAATQMVGHPCAICFFSALEFYGLTDEITNKTWLLVPKSKISRRKELHLFRASNPMWEIGITKKNGFSITSIERTIVDCFYYQRIIGINVAVLALKQALDEKLVGISAIAKMAKQLDRYERIRPYIKALQ